MKRRILAQLPSRRMVAALASATALVAVTSACEIMSPAQTNVPYDAGNGVEATIDQLAIRGLVLVGGSGPAIVSGSAINLGSDPLTVQFAAEKSSGGGSELQLAPREQVDLATKGLELKGLTTKPGGIANVMITSSVGGTTVLGVPVLPRPLLLDAHPGPHRLLTGSASIAEPCR
ncbi:MAG: hypothetical protein L0H25_09550 [Micrococcales bacterium]|nr:hypothetical protein [Micrococcales bacterium]